MGEFLESERASQEKCPYDHLDALAGCEELVSFIFAVGGDGRFAVEDV